jgi:hypothetical protein
MLKLYDICSTTFLLKEKNNNITSYIRLLTLAPPNTASRVICVNSSAVATAHNRVTACCRRNARLVSISLLLLIIIDIHFVTNVRAIRLKCACTCVVHVYINENNGAELTMLS